MQADPQVKSYLVTIGGSLVPGAMPSTNTAEFTVLLVDGARADAVRPPLQQQMAELDESAGEVHRDNDQQRIVARTTSRSRSQARTLQACRPVPSESSKSWRPFRASPNIRSNLEEQRKVLKVILDKKKAASLGFTQGDVGQAISNALTRHSGRLGHARRRTAGHLRSESGCRRTESRPISGISSFP